MSARIYADLPEDFVRRMRNWARARSGQARGHNGAISSIYTLGVRVDRYVNTEIPTLLGEADDTERALHVVPIRYRQAVQQFWMWEGRSLRDQARLLKPGLSFHTFEAWVIKGHEMVRSVMAQAAGARIEERVLRLRANSC